MPTTAGMSESAPVVMIAGDNELIFGMVSEIGGDYIKMGYRLFALLSKTKVPFI
jgi:hypothetical protein